MTSSPPPRPERPPGTDSPWVPPTPIAREEVSWAVPATSGGGATPRGATAGPSGESHPQAAIPGPTGGLDPWGAGPSEQVVPWSTAVAPAPLDLPLIGATYPQVLRTPRHRWWRPLLSLLVVAVLVGAELLVVVAVGFGAMLAEGGATPAWLQDVDSPGTTLLLDLVLAALIGVALLGITVAHPVRARFLHSVEGRVRWAWLARVVVWLMPIWIAFIGLGWWLDGAPTEPRAPGWPWLLLMGFVLTPFQAAGEEYLFRGWVLTSIGSWFRHPAVALVVPSLVSAVLFAAAHGSSDPWILAQLGGMGLICCVLAWRTGGLEAGVGLHLVNNVVVLVVGTLNGTAAESYVDATTTSTPEAAAVSIALDLVAAAVILWQARRAGIARTVPPHVGARP